MVALCRKHHDDAEGGAFTADQLRALKVEGLDRNRRIAGRFLWRRQQLLVHAGQTLTFEAPVPLAFNGLPVISLSRDDSGNLLLSINMLTTSIMPRLRMFENDWVSVGNPTDLDAPPFGRKLCAHYPNGDEIRIEFKTVNDPDELAATLPNMTNAKEWASDLTIANGIDTPQLKFPAVLADVSIELPDAGISVTSAGVKTAMMEIREHYGAYGACAVSLGHIPAPFPTMVNSVGVSRERPFLRLASMNDETPWSVSDRRFRHMAFLLDGYEFEQCTFEECCFAARGHRFGLRGNDLGVLTLMSTPELQNSYSTLKDLTEVGFPTVIAAAERLGEIAAQRRRDQEAQR
jgi:hypothetical protein